jgi:DNA helicase HerA-like ATPase
MAENKQTYSLALTALAELQSEVDANRSAPKPALPTLDRILAQIGPLPREALFLGMAEDGLPVLLNMRDPAPGPILVIGDAGSGKTAFLKNIVRALALTHDPAEVQFGVITAHIEEWENEKSSPQRVAIFSAHETGAEELLLSLAAWAHNNKNNKQTVLLLMDDLEAVSTFDFDALQNLRWLLQHGPSRRVWPILTLNAERYGKVISWIPGFRTRVFGRIKNIQTAAALGGDSSSRLDELQAGRQFSLRENGEWLRFWSPGV